MLLGQLLFPTREVSLPVLTLEGFWQRQLHNWQDLGHNESMGPHLGLEKSVSFSYRAAPAHFTVDGDPEAWLLNIPRFLSRILGCGSEKGPMGSPIECIIMHVWSGAQLTWTLSGGQGEQLEEGNVASSSQLELYPREKVAAVVDQSLKNFKMATLGH